MFPSRSSNRSKIKIVDRPTSLAVSRRRCATAGAVAAAPTDRAAMSAYQASVSNNKQRHALHAVSQRCHDMGGCQCAIWSNTRTDCKHLQSCVPTLFTKLWWLQTHVAAVTWEWRTIRHQKNDGGRLFLFHAVGSSHWQTESRIGRNVPCWQKWTAETSVGELSGGRRSGNNCVQGECPTSVSNLRRSD